MSTTTETLHTTAADALVGMIPTAKPLTAAVSNGAPVGKQVTTAVTATFVGAMSADLAVALIDQGSLAVEAGSASLDATDVLRPALEAATAQLGAGVLGDARIADATDLFEDDETQVFELSNGAIAGWFAIRIRQTISPARTNTPAAQNLSRIKDVGLALTVEIGRNRVTVQDYLNLQVGSVVELDRAAGEHADILVNGKLVAKGQVVVQDGDFAVKVTEIRDNVEVN